MLVLFYNTVIFRDLRQGGAGDRNGTKLTTGLTSDVLLVLSEAVLVISKAVIVIEKLAPLSITITNTEHEHDLQKLSA